MLCSQGNENKAKKKKNLCSVEGGRGRSQHMGQLLIEDSLGDAHCGEMCTIEHEPRGGAAPESPSAKSPLEPFSSQIS